MPFLLEEQVDVGGWHHISDKSLHGLAAGHEPGWTLLGRSSFGVVAVIRD